MLPSPLPTLERLVAAASPWASLLPASRFSASIVTTSAYRSARAVYGLYYHDDARLPHWKHVCGAETALGMMTVMGGGRDTWRLHLIPMRLWGDLDSLFAICRGMEKTIHSDARCWRRGWLRRRARKSIRRRRRSGG